MKFLVTKILFLIFICIDTLAITIELTNEEKNFIKQNPIVTIGMLSKFSPFSYYTKDTPIGFEHDLLKIVSKKTGLQFKKKLHSWPIIYDDFKNKKLDIITGISYKPERDSFVNFTKSYYDIPIIIFVQDSFHNYKDILSLKGKKLGIIKDVFYVKELQAIEGLNLIYYEDYEQLTKDLAYGKIDALVQNLPTINYLIKKNAYINLKLAGELVLPNIKSEDLRFGLQKNKPELQSIFEKAMASITDEEIERLKNKWIGPIKEYKGQHIELDTSEIAYLDIKTIKFCINPAGLPFEGLDKDGKHIGMSKSYYGLFENMLSAKFQLVSSNTWDESIKLLKEHKCDMLAFSMKTPDREQYLNFTDYYLDVPLVIAAKINVPFINNLFDLKNEKIGITKGDAFVKILKRKYPSLQLVEVTDIHEGLEKVQNGQLFGYIDALSSIGYQFQSKYIGELKIAGKLLENLELSIAINKNEPLLLPILQKVINSISDDVHRNIFHQSIPIKYEKIVNYDSLWKISLAAILLISLIIYWNTQILKANKLLKKAKQDIESKNLELENLATIDKLTNLYNRRKLEEIIQEEINRCERFKHTFTLIILDIDYFKDVNDTYGHQIGDKVLAKIANILTTELRKTDFVGRFGGEEFILICPESTVDKIHQIIESLRLQIANNHFEKVGYKTASFGLTMYKEKDNIESIIKRADDALYQAKSEGRNKVVINL